MALVLCDQDENVLATAAIIACLMVSLFLVAVMILKGCGHRSKGGSFRGEKMAVGAHWVQAGTYGHTGDTLPTYGDSGYYDMVPTPPWA